MNLTQAFSSSQAQYRYQFRKWDARKRTTTQEKAAIVSALGKRNWSAMSTDDITLVNDGGDVRKKIDKTQLGRYLQTQIRNGTQQIRILPGMYVLTYPGACFQVC